MAPGIAEQVESPLQTPPDVHTEDNSEATLRKLNDFKTMMSHDRLGFLYQRWRNHQCADPGRKGAWQAQPMYGEGWQEKEDPGGGLYQLKIINWGMMWGARGRLNNLHTAAQGLGTASDQIFQAVHTAWTSKAGDAAAGKFNDLHAAAQDYADQLQTLGAQMEGAWRATKHAIDELADFPNRTDVGGKPLMDRYGAEGHSDDTGNDKRGQMSRWIDEMERAIRNGTLRWGPWAHEVIGDGGGGGIYGRVSQDTNGVRSPGQVYLTDGDNVWANETCNWMDDFSQCYFLTVGNFRRRVEETIKEVKKNWDELNSHSVALLGDPFGKLSLAAAPPEKGKDDGKDKGQDTGGGKKETGGGGKNTGGGGHDTGGPGHTGGQSSEQPPPIQQPPPVQPVDGSTTPSQTGGPGNTGVDPSGHVPRVPGSDQPGQPGQPTQGHHETVTIQDGDRKISVDSPDGQGHVKLTVDDGSGHPKTYDMDFSAGQDPSQQHQAPGQPGTGQQGAGQQYQTNMPGQGHPAADGQGQFGPTGQGQFAPNGQPPVDGQPGTQDVQHAQAGPDGKAVIHDGNVTITAEQPPGHPDQVKIMVDDGTGHPSTYMVDYADPASPQVQPGQPQAFTSGAHAVDGGFAQHPAADQAQFAHTDQAQPAHALTDQTPQPAAHALTDQTPQPAAYGVTDQAAQPAAYAQTDQAVWSEPQETPLTTSVQSTFALDGVNGAGSGIPADSAWSTQGDLLDSGGHDHGDQGQVAPAGDAGLAAVPDDGGGQHQQQGASPAMGGMPMGAMGAGGGGGGDQERGPSSWSTQGDLFDDGPRAADRISSVLGDDDR
jgi:hypothetical protein